jgi:hypothetical protein
MSAATSARTTQAKGRAILDGQRAGEVSRLIYDQSSGVGLGGLIEGTTFLSGPRFRRGAEEVEIEAGLVAVVSAPPTQANRIDVSVTRPPLGWVRHAPIFSAQNLAPGEGVTIGDDGETDAYVRGALRSFRAAPGDIDGPEDELCRAAGRWDLVKPEYVLVLVAPEAIAPRARGRAVEFLRSLAVELDCLVLLTEHKAGAMPTAVPLTASEPAAATVE